MQQKEGTLKSTHNTNLYWRCWLPDGKPKAVILVAHGLAEHISRYSNLVNHVVPRGYAVYGVDHDGHGKSDGRKGYVERFQVFLNDFKAFDDFVRNENPGAKMFLLGHSMGGLLAVAYGLEHQKDFAGMVVSAPLLKPGESITPATITLARIVSVLAPRMGVAVLDSTFLSRDKSVVEAYDTDPLVYRGKISARLGAEMFDTMNKVQQQLSTLTIPVLILQGAADQLVNPAGGKMLYEGVGCQDKTYKLYDGFYHELCNEPDRDKVFADLDAWLDSH
jgi:alpha-beta hydrolase superfamily lysophospholipase